MAVRKFKPTTPGQRHKIIGTFEEITASVPEKSLVFGKRSTGGRNNVGKMTMRYMGGGHKRKRSAGNFAQLTSREGKYCVIKLPSGEVRQILSACKATIGSVGNSDHGLESSGKAGRTRWMGRRPRNRGVVMNPVDHPMGGGEGRASGGHPRSRTGLYAKGLKTRAPKKQSSKYIIERRK